MTTVIRRRIVERITERAIEEVEVRGGGTGEPGSVLEIARAYREITRRGPKRVATLPQETRRLG
jgi:hypothetical protein